MDIHKFELFLDLSETLNYTETAENQFTTQGNVSKQIIYLEKELGTKLFKRTHRKIELTEAGRLTVPYAQKIVKQYGNLKQILLNYEEKENLSLSILTIPTLADYQGFHFITQFLKEHPEIDVQFKEAESNLLFPFLDTGTNHIIYARSFEQTNELYEQFVTEKDDFVAVVFADHPLANKEMIEVSELKNDKFLLLNEDTHLYQPVLSLCEEAGFDPKVSYEGARMDLVLNMVSSEIGITIAMRKTVEGLLGEHLRAIPIHPTKTSYLSFFHSKGQSTRAVQTFWDFLEKQ